MSLRSSWASMILEPLQYSQIRNYAYNGLVVQLWIWIPLYNIPMDSTIQYSIRNPRSIWKKANQNVWVTLSPKYDIQMLGYKNVIIWRLAAKEEQHKESCVSNMSWIFNRVLLSPSGLTYTFALMVLVDGHFYFRIRLILQDYNGNNFSASASTSTIIGDSTCKLTPFFVIKMKYLH